MNIKNTKKHTQDEESIIKDKRRKGFFMIDDTFVDEYIQKLGNTPAQCRATATLYMCICRHSNKDTGKAFPSQRHLGKLLGEKTHANIKKYTNPLVKLNIISIKHEESKENPGRFKNIYTLIDKEYWKK